MSEILRRLNGRKPEKPCRSLKYSPSTPARSVYSGGPDRLGHLVPRGGAIEAYDRRGNLVGSFSNVIDAAASLGGAARVKAMRP